MATKQKQGKQPVGSAAGARHKPAPPKVRQTAASLMRLAKSNPLAVVAGNNMTDCSPSEMLRKVPQHLITDQLSNKYRTIYAERMSLQCGLASLPRGTIPSVTHSARRNNKSVIVAAKPAASKIAKAPSNRAQFKPPPAVVSTKAVKDQQPRKRAPPLRRSSSASNVKSFDVSATPNEQVKKPLSQMDLTNVSSFASCQFKHSTPVVKFATAKVNSVTSLAAWQERMDAWLVKRTKQRDNVSQNKFENVRKLATSKPANVPAVRIKLIADGENQQPEEVEYCKKEDNKFDFDTVRRALRELHVLIREGYDSKQCELLLNNIRTNYADVEDTCDYWECRAALEQSGNNIGPALQCYRTAIVKGAEVSTIDSSLDKLLESFKPLSISQTTQDTEKAKNLQDVVDIVKTSVVQFALFERKMKDTKPAVLPQVASSSVKYVVTPVRRSVRISRVGTPRNICSTLDELKEDKLEYSFEGNNHLSVRFH